MTRVLRLKWAAVLSLALVCASVCLSTSAWAGTAKSDEKPKTEEKKEEKKDSPEPEITVTPAGVTVHAVSVYAHRLFARLAEKTNLQLVVDDAIKDRKVTVHLSDKRPDEVVDYVVAAYGFSSGRINGITMVSEGIPKRPSSYLLSTIESIPTQYVEANNAKSLLPVFLQDHVKVNQEQNAVVLSAPNEVLAKFREDIKQFDIPAAQIMLEVLVVEFTDFDAEVFDLGLRWHNAGEGAEFGTFPLPVQHPLLPLPAAGAISLRGIADLPDEFRVTLEALVSKRRARVRAAPRIATVSGQYASFFVGTQRYLRQPVEMPEGGISYYIDAGVRLGVRPWTGDGQEIICDVHPEVSTLSAPDPITGLPEKATRTADTTVRVRSGQTIIIGGLQEDEERIVRSKVPVLGDLPLLGGLFRSRNVFQSKTDLVIFITPCVLSQTGHLPAEEEQRLHEQFRPE